MTGRQLKTGYFILEGMNSFASSLYFYYLFFFMQRQFGFGNLENLSLAALNGFIYMFMAWIGGRVGQRFGYLNALAVGIATMATALLVGAIVQTVGGEVGALVLWTVGICFTWPNLEALVSDHEDALGLQQRIGVYNLVWAGWSALAYFSGGVLLEWLGLRAVFLIPLVVHVGQGVLLFWLRGKAATVLTATEAAPAPVPLSLNPRPIARVRCFLRMAWLANPFAYVAINTVVAIVPSLARHLDLSPALAGFFCSIWFFARLGTFLALWLWTGWHYRLRWFLGAYVLLVASFATLLLVPRLMAILVAQITFGIALGLIYYSSLYYSMDAGEAKGDNGGVHEAAIGAGIFAGPALGATALHFLPAYPNSSAWAVSMALCGGMVGLLALARRSR